MAAPTRTEAIQLFSYDEPGYRATAIWVGDRVVPVVEPAGVQINTLETVIREYLPWAQIKTPKVKVAQLQGLDTWISTAAWSDDTGSVINTSPPVWGTVETEFRQIAAKIKVDNAIDVGESDYNVLDSALRALTEMLLGAAYTQFFATSPDVNGPASLLSLANADSRVINPPEGSDARLSFKGLTCLRQLLDVQRGIPEQYAIFMAPDVFGQFVHLMASTGAWTLEPDPISGRKQWFFDRVRVLETSYVPDGNACIVKLDMSVLPEGLRSHVSNVVGRGVLIGSPHAPGGVVSNLQALSGTDQMEAAVTVTVALLHGESCVGWMQNIGS